MESIKRYNLIIKAVCLLAISILDLPLALMLFCVILLGSAFKYILCDAQLDKKRIYVFVFGAVISNILLILYTKLQNFIPFWDYAGYYRESLASSKEMYSDLPLFWRNLYSSMLYDDYTKLPTLFTAPFINLFGGEYSTYIIICYNIFVLPFIFVLSHIIYKINPKLTFLAFLFPAFVNPLLRGYVDSIGLIFIAVWLYFVFSNLSKLSLKKDIVLGLLSTVFIFTRRWYIFFLISVFAAAFITYSVKAILDKDIKAFKNVFINLFVTGFTTLATVLLFFFPYIKRLFTNSFSDTYSAYRFGDFVWNIKYFIKYYGILVFALVLLGIISGFINKKTKYFTVFLSLLCAIEFLLFNSVQTISYHHQYLFVAQILILIIIGIKNIKLKNVYPIVATLLLAFSFLYTYIPFKMPQSIEYVLTSKRFEPKITDTKPINELCDKLNSLTKEGEYVYILSSSETLNDDILRNSKLPNQDNAVKNFFGTAHVDKRDGFPNVLLVAKYIVVADPPQVHLGEENQQIVAYFAREILDGTYTKNLEKIDSVYVDNGVTAHIYERKSGYSIEFLTLAKTHFQTLYPDYPSLYNVDFVYSQN